MRFVIYDDESLEAITVISLPFTDKDMDQRMRERGLIWRVTVPEPLNYQMRPEPVPTHTKMQVVELEFEQFVRRSPRHGEQRSWMCFTRAADLAMLLKPDWLPGQRGAVNYLLEQNDALTKMLMRVAW